MTLTDENIKQFQAIYKAHYGTNISAKEAAEQGLKLVNLLSVIYKPMTREQEDEIEAHRLASKGDLEKCLGEDE